jgi:hypothetical protein
MMKSDLKYLAILSSKGLGGGVCVAIYQIPLVE